MGVNKVVGTTEVGGLTVLRKAANELSRLRFKSLRTAFQVPCEFIVAIKTFIVIVGLGLCLCRLIPHASFGAGLLLVELKKFKNKC